ncbi:MAG: hypothetical protein PHT12_02795 [Patescibacteria group bacterium]|nr:hypothetical protein [Patescibacteria group bacterium]
MAHGDEIVRFLRGSSESPASRPGSCRSGVVPALEEEDCPAAPACYIYVRLQYDENERSFVRIYGRDTKVCGGASIMMSFGSRSVGDTVEIVGVNRAGDHLVVRRTGPDEFTASVYVHTGDCREWFVLQVNEDALCAKREMSCGTLMEVWLRHQP